MFWDIVIAAGVGFTQLVLTWYGVHVSMKESRMRNAIIIGIIGAIGIGLIVYGAIRNNANQQGLQTQLDRIQHNTEQPPKVEVNIPTPTVNVSVLGEEGGFMQLIGTSLIGVGETSMYKDELLLTPNKPIMANVTFENRGKQRVFNNFTFGEIAIVMNVNEKADKVAREAFMRNVRSSRANIAAKGLRGTEVGVGMSVWKTIQSVPLSKEHIDGILRGTSRMYIQTLSAWTNADNKHSESISCVWIQPPASIEVKDKDVVYRSCQ